MEYINGEDLSKLLFRQDRLKEDIARLYISELIVVIEQLHAKNIIYRDLKPENILICLDGHIKLIDFGLVKMNINGRKRTYTFCGTPAYLAPEIVSK